MKSDLDIYAIQRNKKEIKNALAKIVKDSPGNILYLNLYCKLRIGNKRITNRKFNACLYSEDSDAMILFARDLVSEEEIINSLKEADIQYTTIRFMYGEEEFKDDGSFPEIWFASDNSVLVKAIEHSITKGEFDCEYYPDVDSSIYLNYYGLDDEKYEVEKRFCEGLLKFDDKIVLFTKQRDHRNVKERDVRKVLREYRIKIKNEVRFKK